MARAKADPAPAPATEEAAAEAVAAPSTEARWYVSDTACTLPDGRYVPAGAPFLTDAPKGKHWKDCEAPNLGA